MGASSSREAGRESPRYDAEGKNQRSKRDANVKIKRRKIRIRNETRPWLDEYRHLLKRQTVFYNTKRASQTIEGYLIDSNIQGNPPNVPAWENGTWSVWNL
jgi:hypothetical protein